MKILADTHTHTCASTHAYSTIAENLNAAAEKGLELLAVTDHAPAMPDSPHIWHFINMKSLPREVRGVRLIYGIEASILNTDGQIDVPESILPECEVVIASIHRPLYPPRDVDEHTKTWLNLMKNPAVDICGHSGNPFYQYDIDTVVRAAKEADKAIEINNHSFVVRSGSFEICREIAKACKQIGTKVVVSSDAHSCFEIGLFDDAIKLLEDIDFPEELVMNTTANKFIEFLEKRQRV